MSEPAVQSADNRIDLASWIEHRDEAAFARLVERHAGLVIGICRRRLGAGHADEAAQAVFTVLARRASHVDDAARLGAWLHGVAVRVCSESRRAATRRAHHEHQAATMPRPTPDADGDASWDELRPHLDDAIAALSSAQRDVVVGHFLEGMTQSAVAQRLGISEDAAHQRLHYGIAKLRTWFGKRGFAFSLLILTNGLAAESLSLGTFTVEACTQAAVQSLTVGTAPVPGLSSMSVITATVAGAALLIAAVAIVLSMTQGQPAGQLVHEDFEHDGHLAGGWYDHVQVITTSAAAAPNGGRVAEYAFAAGASTPTAGGTSRHPFTPSEAIRIAYSVRYDSAWPFQASNDPLVQLMVMTDVDGAYDAPSFTHLTCAIGISGATPFVSFQDARNLDVQRLGADLSAITELRAVAGGNGPRIPGVESGSFRRGDGTYGNVTRFSVPEARLTDAPGPLTKTAWNRIEVHLRLNRIEAGRAIADGRIAYLINGQLALERSDLILRTARHPEMRFNQLILGPWIERAPAAQTFWIDDLVVTTDPPTTAP